MKEALNSKAGDPSAKVFSSAPLVGSVDGSGRLLITPDGLLIAPKAFLRVPDGLRQARDEFLQDRGKLQTGCGHLQIGCGDSGCIHLGGKAFFRKYV